MSTKTKEVLFLVFSLIHVSVAIVFDSMSGEFEKTITTVHGNSRKWPMFGHENKVVERRKRDTGSNDPSPDVVSHQFQNAHHNQALLHWSGNSNSSVLFMLTRQTSGPVVNSSTLYRSEDYGSTYDVCTMPDATALLTSFFVSPLDPNILLFVDIANRIVYRTFDEGKNNEKCGDKLSFLPERLIFSPYDKNHVLAYSYSNRSVHVSTDLCKTWTLLSKNVNSRVFWGVKGIDPPGTIHTEVQDLASNGYRYKKFTPPYSGTPTDLAQVIDMDSLLVINNYIFVQKSTQFTSHLYVSYKRGDFKRAYFPLDQTPLDFHIVNADESQVFIAANHQQGHVNLYLSDITGQFYTLSLENVASIQFSAGFSADLYEVEGLQGVFIANQQTKDKPKTLITYDKGGNWTGIGKPSNSEKICKKEPCNLHLHLLSSSWTANIPPPLSEEKAPGLIMAQGTVGSQLSYSESNLFISRDGGKTWIFAHEGNYFHNILDQGGAIVAVNITDSARTANYILFSVDEGKTWKAYNFSDGKMRVDGVLNEPGITTLMVSIYGHVNNSGWIVYRADFRPLLTRNCSDDDYEQWSPAYEKDHKCLLGQTIVYERQREGVACINGKGYSPPTITSNCTCVDEDFECDYGYGRQGNGKCSPLPWFDPSQPVGSCPVGQDYMKSTGYRKVASDTCINEPDKYKPKTAKCPVVAPAGLFLGVFGANTVVVHDEVKFDFIQDEGSHLNTTYSWDFGDGHKAKDYKYTESKNMVHRFSSKGLKTVTVTAKNSKGKASAGVSVMVEVEIQGLQVEEPHGAQVGVPVEFEALTVVQNREVYLEDSGTHYVWDFGDQLITGEKPKLTWSDKTEHTYSLAGNYTCIVQATNPVSSKLTTFKTIVYGTLVTVQLSFSSETYYISQWTPVWNNQFARSVKEAVMALLDVDHTRLEVVADTVDSTSEPIVDVSILPSSQTLAYDPNIEHLASKLVKYVNKHHLKIELDENDFGQDEKIEAVKAVIIKKDKNVVGKDNDYTALYVCLPITFVVTAVVVGLVLYYYRKKRQVLGNRYRLLRSRSQQPDEAGNSLLEDEDNTLDDDDDPLIDPSSAPDTQNRLAIDGDDPLGVGRDH